MLAPQKITATNAKSESENWRKTMADVREKLVELLWEYDQLRMMRMSIEECADYLIANGVTIQRWIPVTERLPDKPSRVLVLTEWKGMIVARHTEVGWVVAWNNDQCPKITHWMPLPPKELE